ncbi:hypothetical protein SE23_09080 [Vibrio sinaloensis]|uniref:hypothetical protein n=1 Tax=Photobacterium sp. (strain ATCC 43367) TaxID=379097 RepID=UPI0005802679|nr:hypothetical protein [Vibrio sinaloensis]KIE20936.1 hypothetical protein SE23_09080 [Vibrio sinaloensis]
MNKVDFLTLMSKYDFSEVAELVFVDGRFDTPLTNDLEGKGFVYLWVETCGEYFDIVYVGKAGNTIKKRLDQHKNGFNRISGTGFKNGQLILDGLNRQKRYVVLARKSPNMQIHGQSVPSECVEELAFMEIFKGKLWNRT